MRGLDIVTRDANIDPSALLAYDAPVKNGLLWWNFMGGSLERSTFNLADSGVGDARVIGSPVPSDHYLSFNSDNAFLETPLPDMAVGCWVIVCRSNDTNDAAARRPLFMGSVGGTLILCQATDQVSGLFSYIPSGGSSAIYASTSNSGINPNKWRLLIVNFAGDIPGNDMTMWDMTDNKTIPGSIGAGSTRSLGNTKIGIGGQIGSTYDGLSHIAMTAIYDRNITVTERDAITARLRAHYFRRGITI